jgi:hypothetical protein
MAAKIAIQNNEERIEQLNAHWKECRTVIKPAHYRFYFLVDDMEKIVTAMLRETYVQPTSVEVSEKHSSFQGHELLLNENKNVKMKREIFGPIAGSAEFIMGGFE